MNYHFLQLNPGKTEFIIFGSPAVLKTLHFNSVSLGSGIIIKLSPVVKNLGFRLDNSLTFCHQLNKLKSTCYCKLRQIAKMKHFLSVKQMTLLVQAIIGSLLDYCNSLYYGCSKSVIDQLQNIQNRACRIIFGLKKRESVEEKFIELHWLKIPERIEFKLLLLVYKSQNGLTPSYINDILSYNSTSGRRASTLHIPLSGPLSSRAFQFSGPRLWHNLPINVRNCTTVELFKKALKTHLFRRSYGLAS